MAPNRKPPGNLSRAIAQAVAVETATTTRISASEEPPAGPRTIGTAGATRPNSASPPGMPVVSSSTRSVCTIATARRSAPSSLDSVITCIIEPGLAPISAESRSQPCTTRR